MSYVVRMPQLGMTMEEGIIHEWLVEEGESVSEGDVVVVVETEKTTNDVEAREDGVLRERFLDEGVSVEPGTPIGFIGDPDEPVPEGARSDAQAQAQAAAETAAAADIESEALESATRHAEQPVEASTFPADTTTDRSDGPVVKSQSADTVDVDAADGRTVARTRDGRISPRARSYAAVHLEDPDTITELEGTGPAGAVTEADVIAAVERGAVQTVAPTKPTIATGRSIYEQRAESGIRGRIAEKMHQSATTAPQVTLNRAVPVGSLLETKSDLNSDLDLDISITDFIIKATADALREYPEFNAIYEDQTHKLAGSINIGFAVDIPEGLVTPVIPDADSFSLHELNSIRRRLVRRVQEDRYTMDELSNGTFTVTNLGHFDVDSFDPLLNVPEVAILGIGRIRPLPSMDDPDADDWDPHLTLSLTFDHRAVDGADAARFLDAIATRLEAPLRLLDLGSTESTPFTELPTQATDRRSAIASSDDGMETTIRSGQFEWKSDEPTALGGTDSAPTPVEQFLGSLASCLVVTIGLIADRRSLPIRDVHVTTTARPDEGPIEALDVHVTVESDASHGEIERVVDTAERACFVNRVVDESIERSLEISIE